MRMENLRLSLNRYTSRRLAICFTTMPILLIMFSIIHQRYFNFEFFEEGNLQSSCAGSRNDSIFDSPATGSSVITNSSNPTPAFQRPSCLSRTQAYLLRKSSPYNPSSYLLSKLRDYESLHTLCGPNSQHYNTTINILKQSKNTFLCTKTCGYLIWRPRAGLGNRMLSIASAFLYAILTNRVLLVEFNQDMRTLFCEPFPNSTWILPRNFPYRNDLDSFPEHRLTSQIEDRFLPPLFLYLKLDGQSRSTFFHCDHTQPFLDRVPVLLLNSDEYFVPSLFMNPSFSSELNKMFPEKEGVFHLLGRYLFNPSDQVWGIVTRFYQAYLARADERIGFQIRVYNTWATPFEVMMNQVMKCSLKNKVLPEVDGSRLASSSIRNSTSKAILVASLYPEYSESLRSMYLSSPTMGGDQVIGVYQLSSDGKQKKNNKSQNVMAWAEMYLLSLCDVLVTTGGSTFGYVAQSLGGVRPWILESSKGNKFEDDHCRRGLHLEPCFHAPPVHGCEDDPGTVVDDITSLFRNMRRCEDYWWGVKMVDD